MPPSRRKPAATPPARRPRVAGLRKPSPGSSPSPRPRPEPEESAEEPVEEVDALTGEPGSLFEEPAEKKAADRKPSPRSKARDTGTRKPASQEEAEAAEGAEEPADDRSDEEIGTERKRRKQYLIAGALALVGLLLTGFAVFAKTKQGELDSATSNAALLDMAKTAQVKQDITTAVETLFSYNYNDIAKTENAAKDLLITDTVRDKYEKEFAEVKRLAPQQKMVVTCKVTRSGVILLDGDKAKVLVFVDQTSIRTDQNQKAAGGSQLSVTAQQVDGKWKVSDMDAYNDGQPAANGQQQQVPGLPQGGQQAPPPSK